MKHLVVLSGSGISAESGLKTFRDSGGLWEGYNVYEVATPEAWKANPKKVLEFYNLRRKQAYDAQPNQAHILLARLEKYFKVSVITQNVDDLHERAGSTHIIHLHGSLNKARSTRNSNYIVPIQGTELNWGDLAPDGSQLRPHIVWFGESVPLITDAEKITATADLFLIIGTSLQVYPAAGLAHKVPYDALFYVIDPNLETAAFGSKVHYIQKNAVAGMEQLYPQLLALAAVI